MNVDGPNVTCWICDRPFRRHGSRARYRCCDCVGPLQYTHRPCLRSWVQERPRCWICRRDYELTRDNILTAPSRVCTNPQAHQRIMKEWEPCLVLIYLGLILVIMVTSSIAIFFLSFVNEAASCAQTR